MIIQGFGVGIAANTSFLKEFDLKVISLKLKKRLPCNLSSL